MTKTAEIADAYPLSQLQQGVLFHTVLNTDAGDYVVQLTAELAAWVAPDVFRAAWEEMIVRHALLRTAFVRDAPERPLQVVRRSAQLSWTQFDWRSLSREEYQGRLAAMLAADRRQGFALSRPPLLRLMLIQIADSRWKIVLSFHHILWDGWSLSQLLDELSWCCEAFTRGRTPDLPFRRPFRDYIEWLGRQDIQAATAYWRGELEGVAGTSVLGVDWVAVDQKQPSYGHLAARVSAEATAALTEFGRRHKLTLNTLVQGALGLVLARYNSVSDVVFGATVSGRPADLVGSETMLGLFLNTLPVRVRIWDDAVLEEWLLKLQESQVRAREHDFCQLAEIQQTALGTGGIPLFECILDFKPAQISWDYTRIDRPLFAGEVQTFEQTGYPLTITVSPLSPQTELLIEFDFSEARFTQATVSRMSVHMQTVLQTMPRCAGRRVADVGVLSVGEEREIESWSAPALQTVLGPSFSEDFERQVAARPSAIAVITEEERCTYESLNQRANQLSRYLRRLGLGTESRIGVCLERSVELVTALVATQKAGAVYVPLDPAYPKHRLDRYAEDCHLDALIVNRAARHSAPDSSARRICVDSDRTLIDSEDCRNPISPDPLAKSLAYIVFTSGSTGAPKGAMVEVLGALNHFRTMVETLEITRHDVVAQTASICFDISVWQLLAPLMAGASVRIFDDTSAFDPRRLACGMQRDGVTILQVVPAVLRLLLDEYELNGQVFDGALRWLLVTGEAVPVQLAARFAANHPSVKLMNAYGPAECADDVTLGVLAADELRQSTSASVGNPIANTEVYVLDSRLRLAPIGVVGEIYVAGAGVGRGYVSRPATTAAAFIPHPFPERPGDRLYRTGDLGRWTERGTLHVIGRGDSQIKVNGARVEITEIESVLLEHELVEQAVVVCVGCPETLRLAAFIVGSGHADNNHDYVTRQLMDHLRARLPRFMTPNILTMVDALPLNASGKIEREQLAASLDELSVNEQVARPLTNAEEVMAAVWSAVLKIDRLSAHDDFFELGGHSLLAMQVVSRAANILECAIPLRALFDAPRLADFTVVVETNRRGPDAGRTPLERFNRDLPAPVSSVQLRMWVVLVSAPHTPLFVVPIALRLKGALNHAALAAAFSDVVERHETLRTSIRTLNGRLAQFISAPSPFHIPVIDLASYSDDVEALAREVSREEAQRSFNPIEDHGIRAAVLKLSANDHVLLITLSHLFADNASQAILLADLGRAYAARHVGLSSPFSPLPFQFADYVWWLERWLGSDEAVRQQEYWQRQLRRPWRPLELPTSSPRGGPAGTRFRRVRYRLPDETFEQLHRMARAHCVTLFTAILTAFKLFLSEKTGQRDIWVATMVSTRHLPQVQEVVGPLLTTQILRTDLSGALQFSDALGRVSRTVVDAISNSELPLERVVASVSSGEQGVARMLPVRTLMLFQQLSHDAWAIGDLQVSELTAPEAGGDEVEFTTYELICEIETRPDSLDVVFRYNASLFDDWLAQAMVRDFVDVLTSAAENPQHEFGSSQR